MSYKEKFILRVKISNVHQIKITADDLVQKLLSISETETVCILDSCGVGDTDSNRLIAGIKPLEIIELNDPNPEKSLALFDSKISNESTAGIFTISYDFGLKLEKIKPKKKKYPAVSEPDIFLAVFDCLIIHDYKNKKTFLQGNKKKFCEIENLLKNKPASFDFAIIKKSKTASNFTKEEYILTVKKIQEYIRKGDTYQTNLTQQIRADLAEKLTPQKIFWDLRKSHPAPFASFIKRKNDYVVSISPERFAKITNSKFKKNLPLTTHHLPLITVSPIKGTRPRGKTPKEDLLLKNELIKSQKDRAENTMIVDLLRNDIGRICEYGSVKVEKLCELETHPSIFHLVSTVSGNLRKDVSFKEIIKAIFPCGSITGCPKIRTMQIIDELETANRGISMGAIGYCDFENNLDMCVAIRTMIIKDRKAVFNVGGGIVIDSKPEDEFKESLVKAKALLKALNAIDSF